MEKVTIEVSTKVNDQTHKRQGNVDLAATIDEAVEKVGAEEVIKLYRQAAKTNAENLLRASLRRELEGGTTRVEKAKNLLSGLSAEEREQLLSSL